LTGKYHNEIADFIVGLSQNEYRNARFNLKKEVRTKCGAITDVAGTVKIGSRIFSIGFEVKVSYHDLVMSEYGKSLSEWDFNYLVVPENLRRSAIGALYEKSFVDGKVGCEFDRAGVLLYNPKKGLTSYKPAKGHNLTAVESYLSLDPMLL